MKASELRIGNCVNWKGNNQVKLGVSDFGELHHNPLYFDNAEPTPLTEEWLLKFGFKDNTYATFSKEVAKYSNILISFEDYAKTSLSEFVTVADHDLNIKCEYVHQLQNLFFALTGEELILIK